MHLSSHNVARQEVCEAGFLLKKLRLIVKNSSPDGEEFAYVGEH